MRMFVWFAPFISVSHVGLNWGVLIVSDTLQNARKMLEDRKVADPNSDIFTKNPDVDIKVPEGLNQNSKLVFI